MNMNDNNDSLLLCRRRRDEDILKCTSLLLEQMVISHGNSMQLLLEQTEYLKRYVFNHVKRTTSQENGYATFVVVTVIVESGVRFVIFVIRSGDDRISQIKMNSNFTIMLIIRAAEVPVLAVEMVKIRPTGYKSP